MHKLLGDIDVNSWLQLPSRPIRAAENDPIRPMSTVLKSLLQDLLEKVRATYSLKSGSKNFPVLSGCDDYISRLGDIELSQENIMRTVLLSSDFEDAYTNADISHIQSSVKKLSIYVNLPKSHVDLMVSLLSLVFENSYFVTTMGIYKQC